MLVQATLSDEVIKETAKVKCEICGKEFEQITATHLKTHGINMHEYREKFPDASLISEGCRKKFSCENNGMFGKGYLLAGENHGMYGKHHSEEAKQKQREANLGKHLTEETKQKISDAQIGEKNHMYGKRGEGTPMYGRTCEKCPAYGVEPWNKGETKETNESVKKYVESGSKTRKEFNATEEGQKWLDEHNRGENAPMYGKGYLVAGEKAPMYGRTGDKCPVYKGGISFLPYCEKFDDDLKERVRKFFNRCCYVCGKSEQEQIDEMIKEGKRPVKVLDVHHVNYNKMVCCNDVKPLFVPLCRSCHAKTHFDREYWEEFFTISLEYLTNGKCFLPKKR